MIVSYRDRKTERFANGGRVKELSGFARQAEVRLDRLQAATSLKDLAAFLTLDEFRILVPAHDLHARVLAGLLYVSALRERGRL